MMKIIAITALFCTSAVLSHAQTEWKTFRHKNGFTIRLPASFSKGLLVAAGTLQWFDCNVNKNITLTVETFGNAEEGKLQDEFNTMKTTFTKVSYDVIRPSWFVISGEDDQGISYLKTILKDGVLHTLRISYPPSEKALMDAWIPRITASFK